MKVTDEFRVSLTSPRDMVMHAVQGDGARVLVMRLFAGAEPWEVPEGATGLVGYTLPDGKNGCYDALSDGSPACTLSGNLVSAVIVPQLCRNAGTVNAVVILRKDESQISTFPFRIEVEARPGRMEPDPDPEAAPTFAGKLFFGDSDGEPVPLGIGHGLTAEAGVLNAQVDQAYVDGAIAALRADLEYEPISITDVRIQPSVAQKGASISNTVLTWELSGDPVKQVVDGVEVDPAIRKVTLERVFDGTGSAGVTVTDHRGATASRSATMHFYNAVYYSSDWTGEGLPSDARLNRMPQKLQPGLGLTIEAAAGLGEYVLYACPSSYGTPEFWCNGLQGGFEKVGTMLHTNLFGYAENYDVWVSDSDNLRGLTITVK